MIFTTGFAYGASYDGIDGFSAKCTNVCNVTIDGNELKIFKAYGRDGGGGQHTLACGTKTITNQLHNCALFSIRHPCTLWKI